MTIQKLTTRTIRMPKELLDKWLAALRSGEFEQGKGYLEIEEDGEKRYCCLGVLEMIADGNVERDEKAGKACAFPSFDWLHEHNVEFRHPNGDLDNDAYFRTDDGGWSFASGLNDGGWSFAQIADLIEEHAEAL